MSVDKMFLIAINDILVPFIPNNDVDGVSTIKCPKYWNNEETKNASYNLKTRNILIFVLSAKMCWNKRKNSEERGLS